MRSCLRILAVLTCVFSLAAIVSAQAVDTLDPALRARIDRVVTQILQQTGVPSASVAIVQQGKVAYAHAYGRARVFNGKTTAQLATADMRYAIGSISKQFTAAALLMLQEEGKLSLDDPVSKYVPNLTRGDEITIRQLLSHTSGYQDYWPEDYVMTPMLSPASVEHILDGWARKPLDFDPGTKWQYSNTNYVIAGVIAEKVAGEPLFDFLVKRVFQPLGMKSVWNSDATKLTTPDATAYYRHALGMPRVAPKEGAGWMFAAGELAMTAHDLALWDESMIAQSVMKPESYKQMFTEVKLKDGKGSGYGLGVSVHTVDGHQFVEHSGEVSGFVADNEVITDAGVAIAVLTNLDASSGAGQIVRALAPMLLPGALKPEEQQALDIFRDLQKGRIDRTLLAPNLSDYFTAEAQADFRASLGRLGEPMTFRETSTSLRGGMTFHAFSIVYPDRQLRLTTYTYPDGKLEQFLIAPVQ